MEKWSYEVDWGKMEEANRIRNQTYLKIQVIQ
jgi:hypothetical protein